MSLRSSLYFIIALLTFSFLANIYVSQMSILGALSSLIGFSLLIFTFYADDDKYILLFYVWSWFLGPFSFVNFYELGYDSLGRLDLVFSLILSVYFIAKYKVINQNCLMLLLLVTFSMFLSLLSKEHINDFFDYYYSIVGSILISYILTVIIRNKFNCSSLNSGDLFFYLLFFLFAVNISLAYVQLFIPGFHIKSDTIGASSWLFGVLINRPLGLLDAAFRFSLSTLILSYFVYVYIKDTYKNLFLIFCFFFVFPLVILSSKAVGLGIALYIINFCCNKVVFVKRYKTVLLSLFSVFLLFGLYQLHLSDLDKSTGTKVLVWITIFNDLMYESNFFELLFGHGINTAQNLSENIPAFISNYAHGNILYDHEILSSDGFLMPHNIFIQTFYEFGFFVFVALIIPTVRALIVVYNSRNFSFLNLIYLASFTHFNLHNGIFSFYYILPMLLVLYFNNDKNRYITSYRLTCLS
ncbi:hypothetical protein F0266_16365 [Vibrio coralliilyticus]|nr:hypothetical protein [Vibrio coralliilyticus]